MRGYHYTTWEAYQKIKKCGLQLSPLEERHKDCCYEVVEFVEEGCIWVYPEFMRGRELIGMIVYVTYRHDSHRAVCLEVDYVEWESARRLAYRKATADLSVVDVHLNHDLDAGPFSHRKPFDLVTKPVSLEQIQLVGSWDLLEFAHSGITELRAVA